MEYEISSGNVFKDLGLPNPEELLKEAERMRQEGHMVKTEDKQLIVAIDPIIVKEVKLRSLDKNISIKKWVLQAILEKIEREDRANSKEPNGK